MRKRNRVWLRQTERESGRRRGRECVLKCVRASWKKEHDQKARGKQSAWILRNKRKYFANFDSSFGRLHSKCVKKYIWSEFIEPLFFIRWWLVIQKTASVHSHTRTHTCTHTRNICSRPNFANEIMNLWKNWNHFIPVQFFFNKDGKTPTWKE